jgi:hypothetical protein
VARAFLSEPFQQIILSNSHFKTSDSLQFCGITDHSSVVLAAAERIFAFLFLILKNKSLLLFSEKVLVFNILKFSLSFSSLNRFSDFKKLSNLLSIKLGDY